MFLKSVRKLVRFKAWESRKKKGEVALQERSIGTTHERSKS